MTSFIQDKPKKVIFFGDSITQAGVQPTGYITKIGQMLEKQGLKDKYELIGAGVGGNKVYDLYLRLEEDVLNKKIRKVVGKIGGFTRCPSPFKQVHKQRTHRFKPN